MFLRNKRNYIVLGTITSISLISSLSSVSLIENKNEISIKTSNLVAPKTLQELRKMNQEDIIKLPKLDMREYNIVTSVKDQGQEGICWAYAMAAASEVNMLYKEGVVDSKYNGENFGLSAKNIDRVVNIRNGNYDKLKLTEDDKIYRQLGNATVKMFFSAQMLAQQNAPIIGSPTDNKEPGNNAAWLENIVSIPNTEMDIKKAIAKYGAVSFAFKNNGQWQAYYGTSKNIDHATTIVGWDDSYLKEKFGPTVPKRNGAWIVKNSWGVAPWDKGYFYLSYDSYIEDIIALDYVNKNKYENVYYYDGMGRMGSSAEIQNKKTAAIFPVKLASYDKIEKLKGISFGLKGENARVKASVYLNVNSNPLDRYSNFNNPENGIKVLEQESEIFSNKDRFGGLYTMTLKEEIELLPGTNFSIVLEPINDDGTAQLLFSSEPNSYNDLTFYKNDNNKWINTWTENWGSGAYSVATIKALTVTKNKVGNPNNNIIFSQAILNDNDLVYTGGEISPNLIVKYQNKTLTKGKDYDVEYETLLEREENLKFDKAPIGTLKIKLKGKGLYNGEKIIFSNFKEGEKPIVALKEFGNQYDSINNKIIIKVEEKFNNKVNTYGDIQLPNNFEFINKNLNIEMGENTGNKIRYTKNDAFCFKQVEFDAGVIKSYVASNIDDASYNIINSKLYYTGNEIRPMIEISFGNVPLKLDEDYALNYSNNINAGQGEIEINGLGYFTNKKIISFTILKAKNKILKWKINNNLLEFESQFGKENVLFEYYKDAECTQKLDEKPMNEGRYFVKALVPETKNYESIETMPLEFVVKPNQNINPDQNGELSNNTLSTMSITLISTISSLVGFSIIGAIVLFFKKRSKK